MRGFIVEPTTAFAREYKKLLKRHRDLVEVYGKVFLALTTDPHNLGQRYNILKLTNVSVGKGQYRIRVGRWRFRYDIWESNVELQSCGLRREDTYHV